MEKTFAQLSRLVGASHELGSILEPVERNVESMNRYRPDILLSFGSYLEALFTHLHASGRPFHRPSVVVYGGDAMSPAARTLITNTFGIPVFSVYGSYEAFNLGFECTRHLGHHMNVDLYPLRVVDSEGRDVAVGEPGEIVVSNLVNRAQVLLNYRLGDVAEWLPDDCPCGRKLPLLSFVRGRVADWLVTPSGERLHPQTVTVVLEVDHDVLRYQVVQTAPATLTVKLVVALGADHDEVRKRIELGFAELFGAQVVTDVQIVDDLPRTARGKVRTVIGLDAATAIGATDRGSEIR